MNCTGELCTCIVIISYCLAIGRDISPIAMTATCMELLCTTIAFPRKSFSIQHKTLVSMPTVRVASSTSLQWPQVMCHCSYLSPTSLMLMQTIWPMCQVSIPTGLSMNPMSVWSPSQVTSAVCACVYFLCVCRRGVGRCQEAPNQLEAHTILCPTPPLLSEGPHHAACVLGGSDWENTL